MISTTPQPKSTDRVLEVAPEVAPPLAWPLIQLRGVTKTYQAQGRTVRALAGVELNVSRGEFLVLIGRSGCGKSTLLNLLGGMDKPTEGTILVDELDVGAMNEAALTQYRRATVGIVFQFFNLMPLLSALENAVLPALLAGKNRKTSEARATYLLESVGLQERIHQSASLLSGGEMQRVALARALINDPQLVLADEPTGNLDSRSAETVLSALKDITTREGKTVVMVTHSPEAAQCGTQIREMRDGVFVN